MFINFGLLFSLTPASWARQTILEIGNRLTSTICK